MILSIITIVAALGVLGLAELAHYQTGNGKRFEHLYKLMDFHGES